MVVIVVVARKSAATLRRINRVLKEMEADGLIKDGGVSVERIGGVSESPNARQGIKTIQGSAKAYIKGRSESPNARQGIKTYFGIFSKILCTFPSESPNARQGIKT